MTGLIRRSAAQSNPPLCLRSDVSLGKINPECVNVWQRHCMNVTGSLMKPIKADRVNSQEPIAFSVYLIGSLLV